MQISECQFELEQFWEIVIVCKKEKKLSAQNEINTWQAAQPESKDNGEFVDVDTRFKLRFNVRISRNVIAGKCAVSWHSDRGGGNIRGNSRHFDGLQSDECYPTDY